MKTRKNPPVKFTKQKMIDDINSLRKITMEKQYPKGYFCKLFPSLYMYKVVDKLIELGFLKLLEKKGKGMYYKWNFDTKIDLELADALFSSTLEHKKFLQKKQSQQRFIRIKKQELIKSQEKANLQVEKSILEPIQEISEEKKELPFDLSNTKIWIGDNRGLSKRVQEKAFDLGWNWMNGVREIMNTQDKNLSLYFYQDRKIAFGMFSKDNFDKRMEREIFESDLFPEVKEEKQLPELIKLSVRQQLLPPDKLARYLGLVPTEEEIEAWKKQIAYWKHEAESFKIKLEKKSIELEDLESELALNNAYINTIENKHKEELSEKEKQYKKLLSEKTLEPIFVPKKEDKKPFVAVLGEIKKQEIENKKPTKYLKLFGYMIYEKN
jgi:hypothetical protein